MGNEVAGAVDHVDAPAVISLLPHDLVNGFQANRRRDDTDDRRLARTAARGAHRRGHDHDGVEERLDDMRRRDPRAPLKRLDEGLPDRALDGAAIKGVACKDTVQGGIEDRDRQYPVFLDESKDSDSTERIR